jgi:threonyl-tRNA synthetase
MIKVKFPDGNVKEFEKGINGLEIAKSISPSLAKASLLVEVNGEVCDLTRPIEEDCSFSLLTNKNIKEEKVLEVLRHSTAHLFANAIKELYPEAKIAIGPSIDNGFYYDFEMPEGQKISDKDFPKIEKRMGEIIKRNLPIERKEISRNEAMEMYAELNEHYKIELINDLPHDEKITTYKQGYFSDLCRGPHLPSTGKISKFFKLHKIAGAYWRGDSKNTMLTRIYGACFASQEDLDNYFKMLEEAEKRDHRKIITAMDLCHFEHDFAPGAVFWHPKGLVLYRTLVEFMREEQEKAGYIEIDTPRIMDRSLWETSGHWQKYGEHNFSGKTEDDRTFCVKPMNCPGGMLVFGKGIKTYKDLPLKVAEFGKVNRYEPSGSLHGLLRVREFTQDDAHIFCREDQIKDQVLEATEFLMRIYQIFGFENVRIKLSTRPDNRIGSDEIWDISEKALSDVLNENGYNFEIFEGEGAFYGPKLEFVMKDCIGRDWQMGTIQLDMSLPERFDLHYVDEHGEKQRPIMLHRAMLGSVERFLGILVENYAGHLPLWLAPVQAVVMPIADRHHEYAQKVCDALEDGLKKENVVGKFRLEKNFKVESVQKKIRDAQLSKAPYMIIIGDNEVETETVSLRHFDGKQDNGLSIKDLVEKLEKEINKKKK